MSSQYESEPDLVATERLGHVLVITLRREAKRNAVNRALADALERALAELDDDHDLWAGVISGGSQVFCAGSDLTSKGDYVTERGGEYGIIRRHRSKPLVAAVEGAALGGGLEMLLACDLIVASRNASLGLPEVSRGVIPTCGGLFRGPALLPANLAREMVLTGQPISAERAYAAGFVNRVTEPGDALEQAVELATSICANGPVAVQACTRAMNEALRANDDYGWTLTQAASRVVNKSQDVLEGINAFFEKRAPRWSAR